MKFLLAGALLLIASVAQAAPNIVVVMTDDQDDIHSLETMPNVKQLAAEGVRFVNSYSAFSLCAPSRSTFLLGKYPHNHGIIDNKQSFAKFMPQEGASLAVWLQSVGYFPALFGKYINGYADVEGGFHRSPGWSEYQPMQKVEYFDYVFNNNGTAEPHGSAESDYLTSVLSAKVTAFIDSAPQPFFVLVTPKAPHLPSTPSPFYAGTYASLPNPKLPNYDEEKVGDKPTYIREQPRVDTKKVDRLFRDRQETLISVDQMVGDIRAALADRDIQSNTVIIYMSDNGYSLGSHRWLKKQLVYDEANKTPLVIYGIGTAAGAERRQMVSTLDVTATILDIAGSGQVIDGKSLRSIIEDDAAPWRSVLLTEGTYGEFAVRDAKGFYITDNTGLEQYYNLSDDPWLMHNKADKNPNHMQVLKDQLAILKTCAGEACFR